MNASSTELIRRRFGNHRPGLQLLDLVDAAIPVTILRVDVLAQERKPLPLLDEFILRFVHEGVSHVDELAALLGLEREQILTAAAGQISDNHIRRTIDGQLSMTPLGMEVARNLAATQPVLMQLPITFDRLLWEAEDYPGSALISKHDAEEQGLQLLPAEKNARMMLSDITVERFNELVAKREGLVRLIEILRVRKIAAQNQHRYMPAQLLIYGDPNGTEVELGLCVEGELRPDHALQLAAIDAVTKLGMSVGQPEPRPTLDPELEKLRVTHEHVEEIKLAAQTYNAAAADAVPPLGNSLNEIPVRSVSVFEHPEFLSQALDSAKRRLLIISPWVKGGVVNTDFIAKLERRLLAGVEVHVGHGIGPDDRDSDEWAIRKLQNLAKRYEGKFHLVRLRNTHAKILIFDDVWINTSFNWLSFKGDPNRTFRMEEGTLVRIPHEVNKAFDQYVETLARDGVSAKEA
jgi:hypothetical protein